MLEGEQLKIDGLNRVAHNNAGWLAEIRIVAKAFALQRGWVCSDDLRKWADTTGSWPAHPNAWGAVFKTKEWVPCGYRKSTYKSNHARRITVWKLRGE